MSKAQARASAKYDKANTKGLYIKLNLKTDLDIIEYLRGKENVQGYIKSLIRSDMWDIIE
jgi:hypothetical protein